MSVKRLQYGRIIVIDPDKVTKLGLVIDNWQIHTAHHLWAEHERVSKMALAHLNFNPIDIFYSENFPYEGKPMTNFFRYYTPIDNRRWLDVKDAIVRVEVEI